MFRKGNLVLLLLFSGFLFIFNHCVSARTRLSINDHDVNEVSQGLRTLSPILNKKANDALVISKRETRHKFQNFCSCKKYENYKRSHQRATPSALDKNIGRSKRRSMVPKLNELNMQLHRKTNSTSLNLPFDLSQKEKTWYQQLLDRRLIKRDADARKNISKGKQKKAKALGRLLMKNSSNKNDEDIQDDYVEDEDDYFKGVNKNIMNWDDYRNVDGASVMELIALNARHKTNVYPAHNNEYPYRKR